MNVNVCTKGCLQMKRHGPSVWDVTIIILYMSGLMWGVANCFILPGTILSIQIFLVWDHDVTNHHQTWSIDTLIPLPVILN